MICTGVQTRPTVERVTHTSRTDDARATRADERSRALAEAAYELLAEGGMEAVTAEAVATRAGVSRRTLFNYFPTVESALTAGITDWVGAASAALLARPADEPLHEAIRAVMDARPSREVLAQIHTLATSARTSPGTRRYGAEFTLNRVEALEDTLRTRLGPDADPLLVAYTGRGLVSAAETAAHLWIDEVDADSPEAADRFHHHLTRAVDLLVHGLAHHGRP